MTNTNNTTCHLNGTLETFQITRPVAISVYTVLVVIGLLGNIVLLSVLVVKRKLKFPNDIYFFNASLADIFAVCMLPAWVNYALDSTELSKFSCITFTFGFYVSLFIQAWMLILVTLERYGSLVWIAPITRNKAIVNCVLFWVVSIFLAAPYYSFRNESDEHQCIMRNYTWSVGETWHIALDFLITIITFIIPVTIVLALSFKMARWSTFGYRNLTSRTSLILILILTVAAGFWGPFHLFMFIENVAGQIYHIQKDCWYLQLRHLCSLMTETLVFLRSVFNPYIYMIISYKFRQQVRSLLQRTQYTALDTNQLAETMELKAKGVGVADSAPHDCECFL
ncbi:Ja215 [Japanese cytomegalovirus]|nr:Ja215 [Japanese cytomegalovirus]